METVLPKPPFQPIAIALFHMTTLIWFLWSELVPYSSTKKHSLATLPPLESYLTTDVILYINMDTSYAKPLLFFSIREALWLSLFKNNKTEI